MGAMKKAALIGGGALALGAGGHAGAKLLRKKKLRVGTPVSKSKVVNYTPMKTRQAAGRVVEMSARLDAVLRNFAAIDTEEVPYEYGDSYPSAGNRKPSFPCLYLSRSKDKGLMKMPGEGQAVVNYKVKSRNVSEDTEDGVPLYGANIEIRSIEPMEGGGTELGETLFLREFAKYEPSSDAREALAGVTGFKQWMDKHPNASREEAFAKIREANVGHVKMKVRAEANRGILPFGEKARARKAVKKDRKWVEEGFRKSLDPKKDLSATLFLREFAVKPRSVTKLMKTSKLNPLKIRKDAALGEFRVMPKKAAIKGPLGYHTDDIKDARGTAADLLRRKRAGQEVGFAETLFLRHVGETPTLLEFAAPRDRDGEGRFAAGNIPGADDYAIAAASRKKKTAAVAGAGTALAGAAMAGLPGGRKLGAALSRGAMRSIGR